MNNRLKFKVPKETLTLKGQNSMRRPKVLVVDDEEDFAVTLKDILETKGYEVAIAGDGKKALQVINKDSFNIGLVDLNLPDVSGLDLIHSFKLYSPNTELIVITGNPSLPTAVKALNAGAFGYIEKPYNIDRLFIVLERALERQRLIGVLRESEVRYRHLFEELGAASLLLNLRTMGISQPNKAFTKLFGYTETELPLFNFKDFLITDDHQILEQTLEKLQAEGRASLEVRLKRKGGPSFWAEIYFTLIQVLETHPPEPESGKGSIRRCASGSDPIVLVLIIDLTKQKEDKADLLKTKSYLEAIFAGIGSGVAIIDSNFTILDVNPAYCRFYGYNRKEILGKKCYEVQHGNKSPCANLGEICPIQSCRALGTTSQVYHEHKTYNGGIHYLEITLTPLKDKAGNLTSFISVQNDLTEIRETHNELEKKTQELELMNKEITAQKAQLVESAEQLKKANAKLVKLSDAKSEFVSTVSHELRTPLTAVMEGLSLVEDGTLGPLNSEQRRFLVLVKNNTKRLADLINNLLDLSKIEAGRFDIIPVKLNLEKTIQELVNSIGPLIKEKELDLKLMIPAGLPLVLADERSAFRVLMNLLSNALKFTPAKGTITIGLRQSADMLQASVADTGTGIPKDQQHKLFNKFQRIGREGPSYPVGTGLGLALSKELIELNQGQIWVESEEGKGSKFSFTLPVYDEYEDLKKTFNLMLKDCQEAAIPIAVHLFKILDEKKATKSEPPESGLSTREGSIRLSQVLDAAERMVKAKFYKDETKTTSATESRRTPRLSLFGLGGSKGKKPVLIRRLSQENSLLVFSVARGVNIKVLHDQMRNCLQGKPSTFFQNGASDDLADSSLLQSAREKELGEVKFGSAFCVLNPDEPKTIEQVIAACQANIEMIR